VSSPAEDDDAPATPRNTSPAPSRDTERDLQPLAADSDPRAATPGRISGSSTLLSLKTTADGTVEPSDARSDELERRITQLEARIKVLELVRAESPPSDRRWVIWVAVLVALALGWQLRAFFH
jgi:hypothetical protein